MDVTTWLPFIRELGALALLAIVLIYIIREYLPGLTKRYLGHLEQARNDFLQANRDQRDAFQNSLAQQQYLFEEHMKVRAKLSDERHAEIINSMRRIEERIGAHQ